MPADQATVARAAQARLAELDLRAREHRRQEKHHRSQLREVRREQDRIKAQLAELGVQVVHEAGGARHGDGPG